ncbi:helix-turn-helix domain-containing protein [Oribacterium sp. FC2011]|uniref:helix-turn-helix domain-containing protein n=1 Tax=Oribacterium sp. FC2011 TaxID=1408311 RepID=UPI0004E1D7B0|nr:AraC family transcriptional regulator [Oribacterium sp. FC2011]
MENTMENKAAMDAAIEVFLAFNEDEMFYKAYYEAGQSSASLKKFLDDVDLKDAERRHLIIPELLPNIISYEMNEDEYFKDGDGRNVLITRHNRYTPAFLHRHDFYEIIFIHTGHCMQSIGSDRKQFREGDVVFIAPGVYHTMEVFDDDSIILNILLRKSTFYQTFGPLMRGHDLIGRFFSGGLYRSEQVRYITFHQGDKNLTRARDNIQKLCGEQFLRDSYSDQMMVGLLITMITRIMREDQDVMESSYHEPSHIDQLDFQVMRYIQDNLADVTLEDIANHFGFSIGHCSRLIKSTTGQGFNDWHRALRIQKAEHMLSRTQKTVMEISEELGYENPESFIRAFKKELHITPAKYRKQGGK